MNSNGFSLQAGLGNADVERIGEVLINAGVITRDQEAQIGTFAAEHDMRFGEAAVALGIIDESTLQLALASQFDLQIADGDMGGEPIASASRTRSPPRIIDRSATP